MNDDPAEVMDKMSRDIEWDIDDTIIKSVDIYVDLDIRKIVWDTISDLVIGAVESNVENGLNPAIDKFLELDRILAID